MLCWIVLVSVCNMYNLKIDVSGRDLLVLVFVIGL